MGFVPDWLVAAYLYAVIAAYFFGENSVADAMRARNGAPHGAARNLLWAVIWPVMLIEHYIYNLRH